ncbi:MAG: hypothetical protein ACON4I_00540 [Candidatus Puniceispirillaceae bacterium]
MKTVMLRLAVMAFCMSMPLVAHALTFKKGQVLGSDGQIYDGASPAEISKLIAVAKEEGKSAGVFGGNLFVIVNDGVTFIPISDLAGKSEEAIESFVVERVTSDVMSRLADVASEGAPALAATDAAASAGAAGSAPVRQLTEEELGLLEEMEEAASDEEIAAALASIQAADVAGVAAAEAAEATREAWGNINPEDLAEATQQAAEFAAQEAAAIASHMAVENALQALIDSGASEAEIDAFIDADPAPSN